MAENVGTERLSSMVADSIRTGMEICTGMVTREILRALENPMVSAYLDKGMSPYIAAAGALAFSGKEIGDAGIMGLLAAVGINPNQEFLYALGKLHYTNELVYITALQYLRLNGMAEGINGVVEVVRNLEVAPDQRIAGYVIEYSHEYGSRPPENVGMELNREGPDRKFFRRFYLGMLDLSHSMAELAARELNNTLEACADKITASPSMLPYIGAIGVLAFTGRVMTPDNIGRVVSSLGITPDDKTLADITPPRFKNPVIYLISLYYLYGIEHRIDAESISRVAAALGVDPDPMMSEYVLAYYKAKKASW
jgi:ribosomal protein L12E/L44/L45/RPP1/RPP2